MLPIRRTIANTIVGPVCRNICRSRFRGCTAARSPQDQRFHQAAATFPSRNLAGASQTSSRKQCCVARRFVQAENKTRVLFPGSTGCQPVLFSSFAEKLFERSITEIVVRSREPSASSRRQQAASLCSPEIDIRTLPLIRLFSEHG